MIESFASQKVGHLVEKKQMFDKAMKQVEGESSQRREIEGL